MRVLGLQGFVLWLMAFSSVFFERSFQAAFHQVLAE